MGPQSKEGLEEPSTVKRHPNDRPGAEKRTPVQVDADVYDAIRKLAEEDERTIARYVNRVLADHARKKGRL